MDKFNFVYGCYSNPRMKVFVAESMQLEEGCVRLYNGDSVAVSIALQPGEFVVREDCIVPNT